MKNKLLILFIALVALISYSQEEAEYYGEWEIFTFWGSLENAPEPYLAFQSQHTDTLQNEIFPVMFTLPDKIDKTKIISIEQYVKDYGDYNYFEFMPVALKAYWKAMYRTTITGSNDLVADLKFTYVKDPDNTESNFWKIPENNFSVFYDKIIDTIGEETWNSFNDRSKRRSVLVLLPYDVDRPQGFAELNGTKMWVSYRHNLLNSTTNVIAHELGHMMYGYNDTGSGGAIYNGKINNEKMGGVFSTAGPYDSMHAGKGSGTCPPYQYYATVPFHTIDLVNTSENIYGKRHLKIEVNPENNKTIVKLKSPRENIYSTESDVKQVVSIPLSSILDPLDYSEANGDMVSEQSFLIEYKNGNKFENISAMYRDGESRGILISHIIGDKRFSRIIDIETPETLPDGARDPELAWEYVPGDPHQYQNPDDYNGTWYFGKKINDWMDDYAPNYTYPLQGGKSAFWKAPTAKLNESLPSDFFYDEPGRNMFTPSTRPDTRSWKDNETNIAVFIDKIDGDYADLTIYRNYHSNPLTTDNAKTLPDGEKGLSIMNDGYIGENFYVGETMHLYLGTKDPGLSDSFIPKTTLVPGTNMHVKSNGKVLLKDNSKLRLENSKLEFREGSEFFPTDIANLELDNGDLSFETGSYINISWLNSYNITASGTSSFYNSDFNMIGSSVLTVNEGSKLTILKGSNIILSDLSVLNVKSGAELVLEEGVNLIIGGGTSINFAPTSKLTVEVGARIIIQGGGSLASYEASFSGTDGWNGIEAQVGSSVRLTYTSVKNAQIGLTAIGANVNINGSSFVDCYNGVSLTNCSGYALNNSYFKGMNSGYDFGISLTECGGSIAGNTVTNFGRGVILTLSSVNLIKNRIYNNRLSGVYVTGYNIPQMKNPSSKIELNNEIKNNGDVQVLLKYHANVYLADGYNNIYSDPINTIPSVPCIYTAGWQIDSSDQLDNKAALPNIVGINAQSNYWGYSGKISDYFDSFFGVGINTLHQGYTLSYEPYAIDPYKADPGIPPRLSSNEPPSVESNHLSTALMLEDKGNIKPAIKKYEQILSKYPNSPEAYVANARLPELYLQAERDVNELLMAYDEALESDVITDKKFFKQMKITANTKSAKYDDAISIAEEMKNEAQAEEEVILADISIEIANIMKNANAKAISNNDQTQSLNKLLAKLHYTDTDDEPVSSPSDITENILPERTELFQNYPNPFNPVTQIKFALAKTTDVKLSVYNISGQKVTELANGSKQAGVHAVDFDGTRLNSGVYYYTLEFDGKTMTKKMVLTK